MGKIIAIANQKGGVGKTTTTINFGAFLAEAGKNILILDMDPQGNAGSGLGIDINATDANMYAAMNRSVLLADAIRKTAIDRLSIAPANIDLSGLEVDLREHEDHDVRLKEILKPVTGNYDYILVDCPPSLGTLTINSLTAADSVLIPLQCEYFALEGLTQLLRIIRLVQGKLNPALQLEAVLLTMYDSRTRLSGQVVQDVREHFGKTVYEVIIPRNVKLSEAPSYGQPIGTYDAGSAGAVAYRQLAREFLERQS